MVMNRGIQRRIEKLELTPPRALAISRITDAELEACIKDSVMQDIKASGSFEAFCKGNGKGGGDWCRGHRCGDQIPQRIRMVSATRCRMMTTTS
jgi:hypothetical protein